MPAGNSVVASGAGLSKKKAKEAEKGAMGMGDAENLLTYKVTRQQVLSSIFHSLLDQLVRDAGAAAALPAQISFFFLSTHRPSSR